AGQMGGRLECGLFYDARDGGVGAFPGCAACAVCDGDELRRKRLKLADGSPKAGFHGSRFGRKKLEADRDRRCPLFVHTNVRHDAAFHALTAGAGLSPVQIATVSVSSLALSPTSSW